MPTTLNEFLLWGGAILLGIFLFKFLIRFIFQLALTALLWVAVDWMLPYIMPWFLPFFTDLLQHFFPFEEDAAWAAFIIENLAPFVAASFLASLIWSFIGQFFRKRKRI